MPAHPLGLEKLWARQGKLLPVIADAGATLRDQREYFFRLSRSIACANPYLQDAHWYKPRRGVRGCLDEARASPTRALAIERVLGDQELRIFTKSIARQAPYALTQSGRASSRRITPMK